MLASVQDVPYFHDSNAHLISLKVPLKFACALQLGSKLKSSLNAPGFSFNAHRNWISIFMKHKKFLVPQLRTSNKMPSARYVVSCPLYQRGGLDVKLFFEFSSANFIARYNRASTVFFVLAILEEERRCLQGKKKKSK